jgi:polyhydroxyalkanoate synthesis regulator phasin
MAQSPDWKQFLEAGMQFTAMTRSQAQRRARELVREGQLAQERMQSFVEELLETSRKRADEFVEIVRHEVERQLKTLGITPRGARKAASTKTATKSAKKKAPAKKKTATKKKAATKATTKKATKKSAKKKAPAKKAAARSSTKKSP